MRCALAAHDRDNVLGKRMPAPWRSAEQPGFRLSLDTASFAVQHEMPDGGEHGRNAIAAGLVRRRDRHLLHAHCCQ